MDTRGAERVFEQMTLLFPSADLFSPIYDPKGTEGRFEKRGVNASFLNRIKPKASNFRALLPLYPRAIESMDFEPYDLVVSSSSAWAHGVKLREGQRHLCYCHNPFRYAWGDRSHALAGRSRLSRPALGLVLDRWRSWDRRVAREVDRYVANSAVTRVRIAESFGRASAVVHPPVEVDRFKVGTPGESFVVLSELVAHKRIDLSVRAFSDLGIPLTVIGDGPDTERLRSMAGASVEFTGRLSDSEVAERLSRAAALVQCATEEFGIASVEALACGRPVLALGAGGALETVVAGETGEFFGIPDVEALKRAVRGFDPGAYDPAACRARAERFSPDRFREALALEVDAMHEMPHAPRARWSDR